MSASTTYRGSPSDSAASAAVSQDGRPAAAAASTSEPTTTSSSRSSRIEVASRQRFRRRPRTPWCRPSRSSGRHVRSRRIGRPASRRARYRSASREASSAQWRSSTATIPGAGPPASAARTPATASSRRARAAGELAGPVGATAADTPAGRGTSRSTSTSMAGTSARLRRHDGRANPVRSSSDDGCVGDRPLGRERSCREHPRPVGGRVGQQCLHEPGLADPGLAGDRATRPSACRRAERVTERHELTASTHHRQAAGRSAIDAGVRPRRMLACRAPSGWRRSRTLRARTARRGSPRTGRSSRRAGPPQAPARGSRRWPGTGGWRPPGHRLGQEQP